MSLIVQVQGYILITARQELGNKALPGRGTTGLRFLRMVAAQSLAPEGVRFRGLPVLARRDTQVAPLCVSGVFANASWDNAAPILSRYSRIGWRRGGDCSSAVVTRERVVREKANRQPGPVIIWSMVAGGGL